MQTYYDILGIPCGVGVDHIKDSYRLLTKKTPVTDGAYAVLSDPVKKQRYDAELWAAEPQRRGVNSLTHNHERPAKERGKSKPRRLELHYGTTIEPKDYATEADKWLRAAKEKFVSLHNPTVGYQCGICLDSDAVGGGFTLFWILDLGDELGALLLRDENDDMFWSMLEKNYLTQEELRLNLLRWWPALEERDNVDLRGIEMVDDKLVVPAGVSDYPETRIWRNPSP